MDDGYTASISCAATVLFTNAQLSRIDYDGAFDGSLVTAINPNWRCSKLVEKCL